MNFLVIFIISLHCLALELFLTRILNLKAWNHLVYIIIPYAILGYGIGANLCLFARERLAKFDRNRVIGLSLAGISLSTVICAYSLIPFPISIQYLVNIFISFQAIFMLLLCYSVLIIPFIFIGFLVVYLFQIEPRQSPKLYFFDLLGAGLGAFLFYPLINSTDVMRSIVLLSLVVMGLALVLFYPRKRMVIAALGLALAVGTVKFLPEPQTYRVDISKGWEYVSGFFKPNQYEELVSRWHAMGRTNIFRITDPEVRKGLYDESVGTFEINLDPIPEFSYISTNFLAGSPIYELSDEGLSKKNSQVKLFSQAMEFPYTILDRPNVLVIGTGGGRDIFMAHTHGAAKVIGAEINPGIYKELSPGGKLFSYSGEVYTKHGTKVFNLDGRQLVKQQLSESTDLIILNGVDTFSGLSSGAYAYAESFLYTKEAVRDYLRSLKPNGLVNINRWYFPDMPREDLRLFAIALEALRGFNVPDPGSHIIIGAHRRWAMFLIKKTPFTDEERKKIIEYLYSHDSEVIYPAQNPPDRARPNFFELYLEDFRNQREKAFVHYYPFDVSVISDDNPFFYKYYKWQSFDPFQIFIHHHTGTVIFLTQMLVFLQALLFIILFIFVPLKVFKGHDIRSIAPAGRNAFIVYFACLGVGFMFIEIPLMQRFVLLLGSPIYAISVTLAAILISSGIGSLYLSKLQRPGQPTSSVINKLSLLVAALVIVMILIGVQWLDMFMTWPFFSRIVMVCLFLFPIGFLLGMFFPAGLALIGEKHPGSIAWAWGINCGFTVLGSILSIILSQFLGFNFILGIACIIYIIAAMAFHSLEKNLKAK